MNAVCTANNLLNFDLYKEVAQGSSDNIFLSSLSILFALAMAHLGAKGETASQMEKTLYLNKSENFDDDFKALMSELNNPKNEYTLKMANKAFGEKTFSFLSSFVNTAQDKYGASLETLDFKNSAENSREYINNWVKNQTEGKIINLLPEGTVDARTALILVNAIYFNAGWESMFKESNTKEEIFWLAKSLRTSVQMMSQEGRFEVGYEEEQKLQILVLPYKGKELSMVILKPKSIEDDTNGLQQVESLISAPTLEKWIQAANMELKQVHVKMPRFKIQNSFDVGKALQSLNMVDAFIEGRANFAGISNQSSLFISKVAQASFVQVNETGTEAAAATAVVMVPTSLVQPEVVFIADHPFLFYIKDNTSGCILFSGRVTHP